ncbi:hypothetical protein GCM10009853_093730 [Glycomyces scopariae]
MGFNSVSQCLICPVYWRDGLCGSPDPTLCTNSRTCNGCCHRIRRNLDTVAAEFAMLDATPGIDFTMNEFITGGGDVTCGVRLDVLNEVSPVSFYWNQPTEDLYMDQEGYPSSPTTLYSIAAGWYRHWTYDADLPLPPLTVPGLCAWLQDNVDHAVQDFPELVVANTAEIRMLAGRLSWLNGGGRRLSESITAIPCRRCDQHSLWRVTGCDQILCVECNYQSSRNEHERWVNLQIAMPARD